MWPSNYNRKQGINKCNNKFLLEEINAQKAFAATTSHTHKSLTSFSVLFGGNDIASGMPSFIFIASSNLILTSSVPSTSQGTHVSIQEPVPLSTKPMQFCNTAIQVMIVLSYHIKKDLLEAICTVHVHLLRAAGMRIIYGQFKFMNMIKPKYRTLLPAQLWLQIKETIPILQSHFFQRLTYTLSSQFFPNAYFCSGFLSTLFIPNFFTITTLYATHSLFSLIR
jgi:hypothetical protein